MRLYLDTSALVKLLVGEHDSEHADRLWNTAVAVATSRVTWVEARAALAAAARAGRLDRRELAVAKRALELRWRDLDSVELTPRVAAAAGEAAETYALRAHDAVHLASALLGGADGVFATWDVPLARAAAAAGLAVAPAPRT